MIVVFLTFNPLFDANNLNHINDMISSLLYNKMLSKYKCFVTQVVTINV